MGVLFAQDSLLAGDSPIDAQTLVEDGDASLGLRSIEVVALVLEDSRLAQHAEPMSKSLRNEKLTMILARELNSYMLTVRRAALTDIHSYVQHSPKNTTNKLALSEGRALEMEATHHTIATHALVVLHEVNRSHLLLELTLGETLEEIAS